MNPKRVLRRLRDDSRWVGLPPSEAERRRPVLASPAARTLLVTLTVLGLVAGFSGLALGWTAAHPARSASPAVSSALSSSASPSPTAEAQKLTCGAAVPAGTFDSIVGTASLPHDAGHADLRVSNFSAAPRASGDRQDSTLVGLRIDAGDGSHRFDGTPRIALVRDGRVVASVSGAKVAGTTPTGASALVSTTFFDSSCQDGTRPLPNGTYGLVVGGLHVRFGAVSLSPIAGVRAVTLRDGLLIGSIRTAVDGPWRGTGVPTCGTVIDTAGLTAIRRFAAASADGLARQHLTLRFSGVEPHANAQGWFLRYSLENTGGAPITLRTSWPTATAVIEKGTIVSAPDSVTSNGSTQQEVVLPGKSLTLLADAPDTGCGGSIDGSAPGPALPGTTHTAYLDFCATTAEGTPVVAFVTYTESRGSRPKVVG